MPAEGSTICPQPRAWCSFCSLIRLSRDVTITNPALLTFSNKHIPSSRLSTDIQFTKRLSLCFSVLFKTIWCVFKLEAILRHLPKCIIISSLAHFQAICIYPQHRSTHCQSAPSKKVISSSGTFSILSKPLAWLLHTQARHECGPKADLAIWHQWHTTTKPFVLADS